MLNNKEFAVTAVLYTLLIAFLMFLGAALAMFSSSTRIIGNANDDLINGANLSAVQVKQDNLNKDTWYQTNTLVRINSRYGTMYWPRDFYDYDTTSGIIGGDNRVNNNLEVLCSSGSNFIPCNNINLSTVLNSNTNNFLQNVKINGVLISPLEEADFQEYNVDINDIDSYNNLKNSYQTLINTVNSYYQDDVYYNTFIRDFIMTSLQNNNTLDTLEDEYNGVNIEVKYDEIRKYVNDMIREDIKSFESFIVTFKINLENPVIIRVNNQTYSINEISYNAINYIDCFRAQGPDSFSSEIDTELISLYNQSNNIQFDSLEVLGYLAYVANDWFSNDSLDESIRLNNLPLVFLSFDDGNAKFSVNKLNSVVNEQNNDSDVTFTYTSFAIRVKDNILNNSIMLGIYNIYE